MHHTFRLPKTCTSHIVIPQLLSAVLSYVGDNVVISDSPFLSKQALKLLFLQLQGGYSEFNMRWGYGEELWEKKLLTLLSNVK